MPTERALEVEASALLKEPPDEAAIEAFERTGAIIVRGLIGQDWLDSLRSCYGDLAATATVPYTKAGTPVGEAVLTSRAGMWEDEDGRFRDFLFQSPIARAAAAVVRSKTAQLYEDILITEPAGLPHEAGWHQDEPSWPLQGRQLSSVWLALEPVGVESGAMRFVLGSHRGPLYIPPHAKPDHPGEDVRFWTGGPLPNVKGDPESFTILLTDCEPGDAVLFHPRAIHTAYGSSPEHSRRTFTIRFMGDDVRWLPKKRIFHPWMQDLGLKAGDRIVNPRLPLVWQSATAG